MCTCFASSGMPAISRLQVCVEFSFDPYGRLLEIGVLAGYTFFTEVHGRTKCPVALVSDMYSCLDSCIDGVEYAVSNCL